MKLFRTVPTVFCLALLSVAFAPGVKADEWNKKTTVKFSGPVEIPGVHLKGWGVLPAGTYVFKLLDSSSDRHIVEIFNADETKIIATVLAIPNYRLTPTDKTVITFNEGLSGRPEAIRAWFYPGDNFGQEFVYPKARAAELAKVTQQPVPAVTTDVQAEVATPEAPQVAAELKQAPVMAVQPTGDVVELAEVIQSTPPKAAAQPAPATPASLPATASPLPLIALCGLLALGGALTVRSMRNRAL